ncbi:tRNA (adenosine(37)-N6)-threonylcarbamoyltransferase complex dimerization subunit type 1 TsaB [Paenibacillus kobensis]|uniref:tRNA (adenosine(37)-N6)-threonylcarbamoyltransferase complex dimerization subunit type 1 TsaB n=1 Tax=Paenibacillus kobensis TaxID=59841 RepID=UPI001FEC5CF8|nr:tRNA (adenosine(37)-N6)-threonylcarbamoyltransferase complex dimerization subunit type 1 TsaB [Paenibacillus kobensis]
MNGMSKAQTAAASPVVVALDTSTAAMSMAIVRGREVLGEVQSMADRNHSVEVVTKLKQLMASCGVAAESLDAIAVGRGPGSYTGMRIGVTVAKTLAWAWSKPIVGVSSLEALAYGSRVEDSAGLHWIVPIMDARRGQVYTAAFAYDSGGTDGVEADHGSWGRLDRDGIRMMNEWADALYERVKPAEVEQEERAGTLAPTMTVSDRGRIPASITICGELSKHEEEAERLKQLCEGAGVRVVLSPVLIEGRSVALLGLERVLREEHDDVHSFVPNYTQLTEAEVKLKEKQAERDGQ